MSTLPDAENTVGSSSEQGLLDGNNDANNCSIISTVVKASIGEDETPRPTIRTEIYEIVLRDLLVKYPSLPSLKR